MKMSRLSNILKRKSNLDYDIVVSTNPNSSYAESFRKIPIDIRLSAVDNEPTVIQITSSLSGEHKTTTAANLAAVYTELGHKVVIVDCDLRKPKAHRALGVLNEDGLSSYLVNNIGYEVLIKTSKYLIDLVNAGDHVPFPHVILRSEKFKDLIKKLRNEYDYVILDCPPVLQVTDSLIISEVADTTLFVINQRNIKKTEAKEAIRLLKEAKANISGIVLSDVSKSIANYNKYDRYY